MWEPEDRAIPQGASGGGRAAGGWRREAVRIILPPPRLDGPCSVEAALARRASVREYGDAHLELAQVAQVLWAAQGAVPPGRRTTPSAGALYPLEVYLVAGAVEDLPPGVYGYRPAPHDLVQVVPGDLRRVLEACAPGQPWIADAAAVLVVAAVPARVTWKYGRRGVRYVCHEAGHAAQNVYLQCGALGLGTVAVGAFADDLVRTVLRLPASVEPLTLMPIGPI